MGHKPTIAPGVILNQPVGDVMSVSTSTLLEQSESNATERRSYTRVLPEYLEIAMAVADKVYNMVSLDRLVSLRLSEIGELVDGPGAMLKIVWVAKWNDGHTKMFPIILPEAYAGMHPAEVGITLEHRLLREVYQEDTILSL